MNDRDPGPSPLVDADAGRPASPNRFKALRVIGILVGLALLGGAAVLYLFDPAVNGFYPRCQLYRVTGLQCPGCGGLRALHALLHGHVVEAFRLNPLFVGALPAAGTWVGVWLMRKRRDPAARLTLPTAWIWAGVAIVIAYGVARNFPFLSRIGLGH